MRRRAGFKPSRSASAFGVFVGIGMACFGVFLLSAISGTNRPSGYPGGSTFPDGAIYPDGISGAPSPPDNPGQAFGTAFLIFWLICVFAGIIFHLRNALDDNAPPVEVMDYDVGDQDTPAASPRPNTADQLRELEQLRNENLISHAEYDQKRREIISRL